MSDTSTPTPATPPPHRARHPWLSPINQRRIKLFRSNRRGALSLWIFLLLFTLSLFAEFLCNNKPILAYYKGELLFPIFKTYPDAKFGGFLAYTNYRDPDTQKEINEHGWMIWPPIRFTYNDKINQPAVPSPTPPTWTLSREQCAKAVEEFQHRSNGDCNDLEWNWLGLDMNGFDLLARTVYGFRVSALFGLIVAAVAGVIGVAIGAVQGYFGGWTDLLLQRFIEIWSSMPLLYIIIILSAVLAPSFFVILAIVLMFAWIGLVHVVRAEFFRARNFEYVKAARALGLSDTKIMIRHVLPNAMTATLTFVPFMIISAISTLTSLDVLGFGLPPGSASLGNILLQGKEYPYAPWIGLTGFFAVAIMLSLMIFIGEAVRDAFDPRKTL